MISYLRFEEAEFANLTESCCLSIIIILLGLLCWQTGPALSGNDDSSRARVSVSVPNGVGLDNRDLVLLVHQADPFVPCAWVEAYRPDALESPGENQRPAAETYAGASASSSVSGDSNSPGKSDSEFNGSTAVMVALTPQPDLDAATKDGVAFTFVVDR